MTGGQALWVVDGWAGVGRRGRQAEGVWVGGCVEEEGGAGPQGEKEPRGQFAEGFC